MRAARDIVIGSTIAVVVIAVVGGLILLGPPAEERVHRLDERRVQDLRGIAQATDLYWTRHGRLPVSLGELSGDSGANIVSRDPATAEPYGYQIFDVTTYELCGSFERDSSVGQSRGEAGDFWSHGAGRRCFVLKVREIRQ